MPLIIIPNPTLWPTSDLGDKPLTSSNQEATVRTRTQTFCFLTLCFPHTLWRWPQLVTAHARTWTCNSKSSRAFPQDYWLESEILLLEIKVRATTERAQSPYVVYQIGALVGLAAIPPDSAGQRHRLGQTLQWDLRPGAMLCHIRRVSTLFPSSYPLRFTPHLLILLHSLPVPIWGQILQWVCSLQTLQMTQRSEQSMNVQEEGPSPFCSLHPYFCWRLVSQSWKRQHI